MGNTQMHLGSSPHIPCPILFPFQTKPYGQGDGELIMTTLMVTHTKEIDQLRGDHGQPIQSRDYPQFVKISVLDLKC